MSTYGNWFDRYAKLDYQLVYLISLYLSDWDMVKLIMTCKVLYQCRPFLTYRRRYNAPYVEERGIPMKNFTWLLECGAPRYPVYEVVLFGHFSSNAYLKYVRILTIRYLNRQTTISIPADYCLHILEISSNGTPYSLDIHRDLDRLCVDNNLRSITCKNISELRTWFSKLKMFEKKRFDCVSIGTKGHDSGSEFILTRNLTVNIIGDPEAIIHTTAEELHIFGDLGRVIIEANPIILEVDDINEVQDLTYSRLWKLITVCTAPSFSIPTLRKIEFRNSMPDPFSYRNNPQLQQVKLRKKSLDDAFWYPAMKIKYKDGTSIKVSKQQRWCIENLPYPLAPVIAEQPRDRLVRWLRISLTTLLMIWCGESYYLDRILAPLVLILLFPVLME